METKDIEHLAQRLLVDHNLTDWQFRFDHARQRCGCCNYQRREISMSKHFARLNGEAEVRNTLLHEIAHALVGPGHNHNEIWRRAAANIGAKVETTNTCASMPQPKWHLVCLNCAQTVAKRHRRNLDLHRVKCAHCGPLAGELEWHQGVGNLAAST